MSDSLSLPASEPRNLESCSEALRKELSIDRRVYEETERALGEIARMYYPRMASWEPNVTSMLMDRIRCLAHYHSLTLANLDFASKHFPVEPET